MAAAPSERVVVPGGEFRRGSERAPDEQPVRTIQLTAFEIERTEVSIEQFEQFVRRGWHDDDVWSPAGVAWRDMSPGGAGADFHFLEEACFPMKTFSTSMPSFPFRVGSHLFLEETAKVLA